MSSYSENPSKYVRNDLIQSLEVDIAKILNHVEKLGADPRLTDVVFLLGEAKQRLEGYRKDEPRRPFKVEWPGDDV